MPNACPVYYIAMCQYSTIYINIYRWTSLVVCRNASSARREHFTFAYAICMHDDGSGRRSDSHWYGPLAAAAAAAAATVGQWLLYLHICIDKKSMNSEAYTQWPTKRDGTRPQTTWNWLFAGISSRVYLLHIINFIWFAWGNRIVVSRRLPVYGVLVLCTQPNVVCTRQ